MVSFFKSKAGAGHMHREVISGCGDEIGSLEDRDGVDSRLSIGDHSEERL